MKLGRALTDLTVPGPTLGQTAMIYAGRVPVLFTLSFVLVALGLLLPEPLPRGVVLFAGFGVAVLGLTILALDWRHRQARLRRQVEFDDFTRHDRDAVWLSDLDGWIERQNIVAQQQFALEVGGPAAGFLGLFVASPTQAFLDLRREALANGRAEQRMPNVVGAPRLLVTRVGDDGLIWRLDRPAQDAALAPAVASCLAPGLPDTRASTLVEVRPAATDPGSEPQEYLEELPVPILQIDRAGMVEYANRRARQLLEDIDVVGHPLSSLVEGLGRPIREWLNDGFDGRGLHRPEVVRITPGALDLYLQITLGQMGIGPDMRLVAVLHDATELKTLELQFVQSQKMQAIGQLAGGVAHDFNNLLTAISGHCDLLLLRRDEMDPDFADLEQINQNANRAASLVGQLLAFSRKQNLRPEFLDLRLTLADLTHLLNRLVGEKVHLAFSHDPALQAIRADKRQLEQVIMNLVVNARDAMPEGGHIDIETQVETLVEPLSRDRVIVPPGIYVTVRVRDEGMGIPPDKLPKIFEPFFTTKKTGEGTGLGLSTAYGIVKQTGGFIFADSTVGEGSVFSLYFPAHQRVEPGLAAAPLTPKAQPAQAGDGVVLLVEDEAPVRAFACRALRLRGYTVIEAENGEEALEILEDGALKVDIFVTDVIMPGMDGPSWVKQALMVRPATKVVFVSGYSEENLSETQATIPNSIFLPKPFSLTQLTSTVQEQLR